MEETSKIPISVGIPQQRFIQDLQFNSTGPRQKHLSRLPERPDETELQLYVNRKPTFNTHINNNKNSYVSGNSRAGDLNQYSKEFLLTLLDAMKNDKEKLKIEIPAEIIIPHLSRSASGAQLRHQLSKTSIQDVTPPNSVQLPPYSFRPGSDTASQFSKQFDALSLKSYTSVGMGSTDGKKMIVRKIPTSPVELFNLVNPPMPPVDNSPDSYTDSTESLEDKPRRQQWANKLQFVLACVGYSVGLGSVWRFPYLCYKSGGGVFLIPYFIIMVICGVPMLYMELAVGQFIGRGPIAALGSLCPLFKGTGLGSVVISFFMSTYYCVIIAYGVYYFFTSFKPNHPWVDCTNRWNTDRCWIPARMDDNITAPPLRSRTPAEEFYDDKVLQLSKGIEQLGDLRWELVACLLCAWILVYFGLWKSIKSSAKVRYFTATLPFLLIIVFLAKSLTLDGAELGMRYFFKPRWHLLGEPKVWINAAAQTFNSMGIAFGSMISFASYNKFDNNIIQDTLAVSFVNAITSLLVGIFAFATLGNIAKEQKTDIENVITDGPGLIFVVYPQAMAKMPASHLWSVLFFFMLLCLALNSQFAIVEVVVTSIQDGFPNWIKKRLMCHEVLVLVICVVSFLCGLPNVTKGGIYFFQLIDHYAASISIMYLAFFEVVAIAWFYGVRRLSRNIEDMTGRQPSLYFKFCWLVAAPLLIFSIWVFYMIAYEQPQIGSYVYPAWAIAIGWMITSCSLVCIPAFMIYVFVKAKGDTCWEKLKASIKPDLEECQICHKTLCEHTEPCFASENQPMIECRTPDKRNGEIAPVSYSPVKDSVPTSNEHSPNAVNRKAPT